MPTRLAVGPTCQWVKAAELRGCFVSAVGPGLHMQIERVYTPAGDQTSPPAAERRMDGVHARPPPSANAQLMGMGGGVGVWRYHVRAEGGHVATARLETGR
jgi:hypothetical protein